MENQVHMIHLKSAATYYLTIVCFKTTRDLSNVVIFQGDEIGMLNANISYEDTIDPAGCNCGPDKV